VSLIRTFRKAPVPERVRQVEILNGGKTEGMIEEGLPKHRRSEWQRVSA
jgi:hypothetical protein